MPGSGGPFGRVGRCRLLSAAGAPPIPVVRAGLNIQQTWGTAVLGTTDKQLEAMRRTAAAAATTSKTGSRAVKLCTAGRVAESLDPVFEVTAAPLRAWVLAVWLSSQPGESSLGLMGKALAEAVRRPRARCAGPARALLTALHRIRWQALSATKWVTDDGVVLDLTVYSPAYVERVCRVAVWRWVSRDIAATTCSPDLRFGVWWRPMRELMKKVPTGLSYLKRVWCGSEHDQADLLQARRAQAADCQVCGCRGTVAHRHWECPLLEPHRLQLDPALRERGRQAARDGEPGFWRHLLLPHPLACYLQLDADEGLEWGGCDMKRVQFFSGNVYTDGSAMDVAEGHVARAAGGVVMTTLPGRADLQVKGALPGPLQTINLAELYYVEVALRHAMPPIDLGVDCFSIISAMLMGEESCCSPRRVGAHIWRRIWFHVNDMGGIAYWERGSRPGVPITIRWVPAHLPQRALDEGNISAVDFLGNRAVDALAKEAVEARRVDPGLLQGLRNLRPLARRSVGVGCRGPAPRHRSRCLANVKTLLVPER